MFEHITHYKSNKLWEFSGRLLGMSYLLQISKRWLGKQSNKLGWLNQTIFCSHWHTHYGTRFRLKNILHCKPYTCSVIHLSTLCMMGHSFHITRTHYRPRTSKSTKGIAGSSSTHTNNTLVMLGNCRHTAFDLLLRELGLYRHRCTKQWCRPCRGFSSHMKSCI